MKKKIAPTMLMVLIIMVLLSSCKNASELENVLLKSSCSAPCWMGIYPGQSTEEEVMNILTSMTDTIDVESIYKRIYGGNIQIGWSFRNTDIAGVITMDDDSVSSVFLGYLVPQKKQGIQLEVLTQQYGYPNDYHWEARSGDKFDIKVFLAIPEKGVEFGYVQSQTDKVVLSSIQKIPWIWFYDPKEFQKHNSFEWSENGEIIFDE